MGMVVGQRRVPARRAPVAAVVALVARRALAPVAVAVLVAADSVADSVAVVAVVARRRPRHAPNAKKCAPAAR